tara:strand:+ start:436 stop:1575 length:1140 start_codon:yes stop_codon:yes gene_type:complete
MATDVSGTIHIIAEVMGDAGSPIAGTGASAKTSDKAKQEKLKVSVFGMDFDVKQIIKYLTIGGLIANSRTLTSIFTSLSYFIGVIGDVFFRPVVPLLVWTLEKMFKFLTYLTKLTRGEKSFSEVWGDWTSFWTNQWNEGGFLGIIKDMFKLATGMSIFATLIGGLVAGPAGAAFMLSSIFKWSGGKFSLSVIANVIGIRKVPKLSEARKGTRAARFARFIKRGALNLANMLGRFLPVGKVIIAAGALLAMFGLNTIKSPPFLTGSNGLVPKIKEVFFSGESITWKGIAEILGLIGMGTTMSLLHLIELITFGTITAEEARDWYVNKFLSPIKDVLNEFSVFGDDATGFFDSFMSSPWTVGRDFMDIITSPLEVLSREKY